MKDARHRFRAAERIFGQARFAQFKAQARLVGSGNRPFTMRMAGNPNHSSQILSFVLGSTPPQIS